MKTPANGSSLRLSLKSGKITCKKIILEVPIEKVHRKNSRASSTSVTDRGSLFVSFLDQEQMFIAAYDFNKSPGWNSANLSGLHLSLPMENSSFAERNTCSASASSQNPVSYWKTRTLDA
jgi:hypothetical protein